ncbi:MAG: right-handed parallel beta-helix repeat-containing protein, partial [Armatimonadota bacterium]
ATLLGARDAVRKLKAAGPLTAPVTVSIASGTYPVTEPLVLTSQDSGTAQAPVTYTAAGATKPLFEGGRTITGWTAGADGLWTAKVPDVAAGKWYFEQLWVNGHRAQRARTPNQFYNYITEGVAAGKDLNGNPADLSRSAFKGRPQDLAALNGLSQEQLNDVNVIFYFSWESARMRVGSFDPATNTVLLTGPAPWQLNYWGANLRYQLENVKAALDEPGEWFLDRNGTLTYKPLPGENMKVAEVVAPVATEFVRLEGQMDLGLPVEHLNFRGLSFQHGQYLLPPGGHGDGQAEFSIPGAVMLDGARNISFKGCEIKHIGIYAMWFRNGCSDCSLTDSYLEDVGGGGVKIGEGGDVKTGRIIVDNNIIHLGGRMHHGSHGVWIGASGNNQVTHNDISDFFYTTIAVGWSWGYSPTVSHNNKIDFNHLHHLGQGVLSDMGGVYTLGIADGTTVSNNVIHDVYSYDKFGAGGWGLYNDEGSSNITMENNLVYNVKTGTYHQHYGENNTVRNNILANSMNGQLQRSRPEEHNSFNFENNLVYWKSGPLLAGNWRNLFMTTRSNLYWNSTGEPVKFHEFTLEEWQAKGQEKDSIIADPMFVDPDNGNFTLKAGSPVSKIGFKPFDYSKAGVYGDAKWVALAKSFKYAKVQFAPDPPPPPPLAVDDDFELTPVGSRPSMAQTLSVEGKGDSVAVTDELGANGSKQSLKITDAPGLQFSYNPHFAYHPSYDEGTAVCSYDLRLGPGVVMYNEWRDWSVDPYQVAASVWIRDGKMLVGEKEIMTLPVDQWFHVEVSAKVGKDVDGKWKLTVTLPGGQPQSFEFPNGSPKFSKLTWIGFSSSAEDARVFYLDNMKIANVK